MKHFADVLLQRNYDLRDEILAIESIFLSKEFGLPLYYVFSSNFLSWKLRNNFVSFDTFFQAVGLERIVEKAQRYQKVSIDEFIFYCEYMLNVLVHPSLAKFTQGRYIVDNINNVLEKLNYEYHVSGGIYHIIQKDILVSEAADIVQDNYDLGEAIYSFNYREVQGDINKKADILCRLYKYIESVSDQAKEYGYSNLLTDIKDLTNKLDIRHAPTARQEGVIQGMTDTEYEEWLDELFRLSLSLIVLIDYTSKRKDIRELRTRLG